MRVVLLNLLDLSDVTHVDDNYHPTSTGSDHSRAVVFVNNIGRRAKRRARHSYDVRILETAP